MIRTAVGEPPGQLSAEDLWGWLRIAGTGRPAVPPAGLAPPGNCSSDLRHQGRGIDQDELADLVAEELSGLGG